jgi:CO dehydrogenase nickel-insertion accessory protein CooC1
VEQKDDGQWQEWKNLLEKNDLRLLGVVPQDDHIYQFDKEGKPTFTLPDEAPAVKTAFTLFKTLFGQVQ